LFGFAIVVQKKITRQNKFAGLLNQTFFTHSIERYKDTLYKVIKPSLQLGKVNADPKNVLAQKFYFFAGAVKLAR
jgi:hypothetical protein